MNHVINRSAIGIALVAGCVSSASAQWTVVRLHPAGATGSQAFDVDGQQVVGIVGGANASGASLWTIPSNAPINLKPPTIFGANVRGAGGGQQVGEIDRNTIPGQVRPRAALWTGTAASFVDLNPSTATAGSGLSGAGGGKQVGTILIGILSTPAAHAGVWSGTADSFVDLHNNATMFASFGYGTDGVQQVGKVIPIPTNPEVGNTWATLWTGTASSYVQLHPSIATDSEARAVAGGEQVGWARINNSTNAALWRGSAASFVNLNPPGAEASRVYDVAGGMQVGYAYYDDGTGMDTGNVFAGMWNGTAASWVNLGALLPSGFIASEATGIWTDGRTVNISGWAINTNVNGGRIEALLWTRMLPTPACDSIDFNSDGLFPSDDDLVAFLGVLAGGACATCNDVDFNNDGLFPSDDDLAAFLRVLAGGPCS